MPSFSARLGIKLTPLKDWILERLAAAGSEGIYGDALWARLCIVSPRQKQRTTMKVHVNQINKVIGSAGYRISCERGNPPIYRLIKPSPRLSSS
jgi:hypothetical protein